VRADHRIGDDVAIRTNAAFDGLAQLDQRAGAVRIGVVASSSVDAIR